WVMTDTDRLITDPDDGWTLRSATRARTAHSEHTIAITDSGAEILTLPTRIAPTPDSPCSGAYRARGLRGLRCEQRPHSGEDVESKAFDAVLLVGVGHVAGSSDEVEPARSERGHRVRDAACDGFGGPDVECAACDLGLVAVAPVWGPAALGGFVVHHPGPDGPELLDGFLVGVGDVAVHVHADGLRGLPVCVERLPVQVGPERQACRGAADDSQHQRV